MQSQLIQKIVLVLVTAVGSAALTLAFAQGLDIRTVNDIQRHLVMSQAHANAAKCLQSGRNDAVCEGELQQACQGIAIGKYCGMKHEH